MTPGPTSSGLYPRPVLPFHARFFFPPGGTQKSSIIAGWWSWLLYVLTTLSQSQSLGSFHTSDCRGGVQRRQVEFKGNAGGDRKRGTLGVEMRREKSLRIGVAVGRAGRFGNRTAAEGGDGAGYAKQPSSKRHKAAPARDRRLPAHLAVADTSAVTREVNILRSLDVRILAGGDQYSAGAFKAELAALVKSQGGKTSEARSIHWSPYDPVRVVNAVP